MLLPSYKKQIKQSSFFGRENYINIFNKELDNTIVDNINLLMFYGIGGIGKSTLLNNIYREHTNNNYKIKINLEESNSIEKFYSNLLLELDKQNIDSFNLKIAYSIYWNRINPNSSMKDNMLFNSPQWDGLLSVVDTVGFGVGTIFKSLSNSKNIIKSFNNKYKNELIELESLDVYEIEELLPKFLEYDLKEKLSKKNETLIFFIDTYEYLYEHNKKEINKLNNDKFIRDIVLSTYSIKTLFVLFGREKLIWNKDNEEWNDYIVHKNVDSFSEIESIDFLKQNGVSDEISKVISKYTEGVPFYLNLEINTYNKLDYPSVNDFKNNSTKLDIFNRFIMYATETEIQLLKVLSLTKSFDLNLFERIIKEFNIPVSILVFDSFIESSYIKEENGKFFIHNLMKTSVSESIKNDLKFKINNFLYIYYNNEPISQIFYAKEIYNNVEFKNYISYIYNNNSNNFYLINSLFNIVLNMEIDSNLNSYLNIRLALVFLEFNYENKFYEILNNLEDKNLKIFLNFLKHKEKKKDLINHIDINIIKSLDINLYLEYLINIFNINRKEKSKDFIENSIQEITSLINTNDNIHDDLIFKFKSKILLYYKRYNIEKSLTILNELQYDNNLYLKAEYFKHKAILNDKHGFNNIDDFETNINHAISLYNNIFSSFNKESIKCFEIVLYNNTIINDNDFIIYKIIIDKTYKNKIDFLINIINKTEDNLYAKHIINYYLLNVNINQIEVDKIQSLFDLILNKFEEDKEYYYHKIYHYYNNKKDYSNALINLCYLYDLNKSYGTLNNIGSVYFNTNKIKDFYSIYNIDISELSYYKKINLFKTINDIESIYNLIKRNNKSLYGFELFINKNSNISFLLKVIDELEPVLKEKTDILYSYICDYLNINKLYNEEILYLNKQLSLRKKYNLNNIYKGIFYIGMYYLNTNNTSVANKYFNDALKDMLDNKKNDYKFKEKIEFFLKKTK